MNVWLVQGWWYRDQAAKIVGVFATKRAAQDAVDRLTAKHGDIWNYDIRRLRVRYA